MSAHLLHGGCFVSEHPARPRDDTRPSVWTSAIIEILLKHPSIQLTHIAQYRWGASAVKPTGLLHYNMPTFCRDLYSASDPSACKPTEVAIGRDSSGQFRTAQHKEYPDRFCRGLALTLVQFLSGVEQRKKFEVRHCPDAQLLDWIRLAAMSCSAFTRGSWLPDYQL